jgi:hypothetical protein
LFFEYIFAFGDPFDDLFESFLYPPSCLITLFQLLIEPLILYDWSVILPEHHHLRALNGFHGLYVVQEHRFDLWSLRADLCCQIFEKLTLLLHDFVGLLSQLLTLLTSSFNEIPEHHILLAAFYNTSSAVIRGSLT